MSHEFTGEQNDLIGRLANKMSVVGLVSVMFGVLYLLSAVLLLAFIFQDKLPADVVTKIPDEVRAKVPTTTLPVGRLDPDPAGRADLPDDRDLDPVVGRLLPGRSSRPPAGTSTI